LLAETALHHGIDPGTPGERYQVVVHVDASVLADADEPGQSVLEDGWRVSAETSQRLACDAGRVVMQHDSEGSLLEISARTRTIPPALRRALQHRDRGCRFPGCGVRFGQGDVPPPADVPDDPVAVIRARNDASGLRLNAHTATPGWLGERLDVAYAIDVLWREHRDPSPEGDVGPSKETS